MDSRLAERQHLRLLFSRNRQTLDADTQQHDDIAEAIAAVNPCRIISLCPTPENNVPVTAKVSAYCPMQQRNQPSLVCCETITLRGAATELERIGGLISALTLSGLPKFVWWKAPIETESGLFQRLISICDNFIIDSSDFTDPEAILSKISQLFTQKAPIADLNWQRLSAWQELTAQGFENVRQNVGMRFPRLTALPSIMKKEIFLKR